MLSVSDEALRVSRGLVLWVMAGVTRKYNYQPGPEGLLYRWWQRGGECQCWRPAFWHRSSIPGSGGKQWLRADVEYVLCLKRPGLVPWADNTAMGHPPKWAPGGEMSHRLSDGARVNQWGGHETTGSQTQPNGKQQLPGRPSHKLMTRRRADGARRYTKRMKGFNHETIDTLEDQYYIPPVLANPGNLIHTNVGGGQLGHDLAHDNEAPFPEALAEFFIRSFAPPGGRVLDPFAGSGTAVSVANHWGRVGIGLDIRQCQCRLSQRRVEAQRTLLDDLPEPATGEPAV